MDAARAKRHAGGPARPARARPRAPRRRCPRRSRTLAALPDPIGEVVDGHTLPNGIELRQVRVPLGVVAMIYEARPNVTADAAGLCVKTGNAVILRGGSLAAQEQPRRMTARARGGRRAARACPTTAIQSIESTDHAAAEELMGLHGYIDVLIPRGGAGLIKSVVENAKVPVIETGVGNCHVYVHEAADLEMARRIVDQREVPASRRLQRRRDRCSSTRRSTSACCRRSSRRSRPRASTIFGDEKTRALGAVMRIEPATEEDWGTEYLDLKIVGEGRRRASTRRSTTSTRTARSTPRRSSPRTTRRRGASCTRSTPRRSTSTRRRASPTAASSASAPRSASRPRSCTRAGRWASPR